MRHNPSSRKPETWVPYWIESDIYYCPICGSEDKVSERISDRPRPEEWSDRNHIIEKWDYCDAL